MFCTGIGKSVATLLARVGKIRTEGAAGFAGAYEGSSLQRLDEVLWLFQHPRRLFVLVKMWVIEQKRGYIRLISGPHERQKLREREIDR